MSELLQSIRAKYPAYADTPDDELTVGIGDKYPVYLSQDQQFRAEYLKAKAQMSFSGLGELQPPGATQPRLATTPAVTGAEAAQPTQIESVKREAQQAIPALTPEEMEKVSSTPYFKLPPLNDPDMPVTSAMVNVGEGLIEQALLTPRSGALDTAFMIPGVRTAFAALLGATAMRSGYQQTKEGIATGNQQQIAEGGLTFGLGAAGATGLIPQASKELGKFGRFIDEQKTKPEAPTTIGVERQLAAPSINMPEFAQSTLEPTGGPRRALPAPGETEGSVLLPESPLGPRTAGYRIQLPVAEGVKVKEGPVIDIEAQVEGADALRQLTKMEPEQKTPGQPYQPPTVNVDLRQLERVLQRNTVSKVEIWADQVIQDKLRGASSNPFLDPEFMAAAATKGALLFKRGVTEFAEWANEMRKQFGRGMEDQLPLIFNQSRDYWKQRETEVQNASGQQETAAVHGNVRPLQTPAKGVSKPEGGEGVQSQAQGRVSPISSAGISKPPPSSSETVPQEEAPAAATVSEAKPPGGTSPEVPPAISEYDAGTLKGQGPLDKFRAKAVRFWNNREPREAAAFTRDAGDNAAKLSAREATSEPAGLIRRAFPKNEELARKANTFVVEAQGDPARIDEMIAKVNRAPETVSGAKTEALEALAFAKQNFAKLAPIAREYGRITDTQVAKENAGGVDTLRRSGYVMHAQDIEGEGDLFSSGGEPTGFRKIRDFPTYADSIAAGIAPKSLDSIKLLESRLGNGNRLLNKRLWIESLKGLKTEDGSPMAADIVTRKRADGSTYQEAPKGYTLEYLGPQPVAIRNGFEGVFTALTKPSVWGDSLPGRAARQAAGAGKSINLLFDSFHAGRVSFWDSLIKGLGIRTFEAPVPTWLSKKDITLMDTSIRELNRMADASEIPKEWLNDLVKFKREQGLALQTGYNIGRISDSLYQGMIHSIPGIGHFNKWLFDQYQRAAMSHAWHLEFTRRRMARPEEPEMESARYVSKALNTRFGNLGRQGIFKSRSAQDTARFLILAPQWNEGLIRTEIGAVKEAGQLVADTAKGERIYAGVLLRSVGAMAVMQFVANQLINMATRGHPTWQNPEEGIGAKLSAWVPDVVGKGPGFFLHPLGLAIETTHLLIKGYEQTGDSRDTLMKYLRSRVGVAMRPVLTWITKTDFLGRQLKPGTVWSETLKDAIPSPISGAAAFQVGKSLVTGQRQESFPGQFQKQALATVGIKTDQAPSAETRMYSLAKEFNAAHGVKPSPEFAPGDYSKVISALRVGNMPEAQAQFELLRTTKTPAAIRKYFTSWPRHPFTGQRAREAQFRSSLNPEQRAQYDKAIEDRRALARKALTLLTQAQGGYLLKR